MTAAAVAFPYQPQEAAQLIGATRDAWERALLMFPLHTGARMGEQRALRWTDVDFDLKRVFIRRSAPGALDVVKAPKSNRQRWVDLTPELAVALKAIRHRGELIFCQEDGSMLNPGQFHEVLWAAQKNAGAASNQVARASTLVRVDPRVGRRSPRPHPRPPRPLVGENDREVRAPRGGPRRRVRAPALGRHARESCKRGANARRAT